MMVTAFDLLQGSAKKIAVLMNDLAHRETEETHPPTAENISVSVTKNKHFFRLAPRCGQAIDEFYLIFAL